MTRRQLRNKKGTQLKLPVGNNSKTLKKQAIERYLERATKNTLNSSSRTFTHESCSGDSCVNQLKYKAISIWQPWASLIGLGLKTYETRSWKTNYRGKLVICSARKTTKQQQQDYAFLSQKYQMGIDWDDLLFGYALAICDLTDCIKISNGLICSIPQVEYDCGDWEIGRYAWKLDNIKVLENPTPVKGKQRLWNLVSIPEAQRQNEKCSITPTVSEAEKCSITPTVSEAEKCSITPTVSEHETIKLKAIQGYLTGRATESIACVNQYQTKNSKNYYYRLSYRLNGKVKHVHIPGGNVWTNLAQNRAQELQGMIDHGVELTQILAVIQDYRRGK